MGAWHCDVQGDQVAGEGLGMMDEIECWKVVQKSCGRITSLVANAYNLSVGYEIGAWTIANPLAVVRGGYDGLLAFSSRIAAKRYCREVGGRPLGLYVYHAAGVDQMDISEYPLLEWKWKDNGGLFLAGVSLSTWPDGTVMFRKIKLLDGPISLRGIRRI